MRAATGEPVRRAVLLDERADAPTSSILERLEADELHVAPRAERAVLVEHVGDAAAHARGEVAAGRAEHDDDAAGHVLAAVVADALDDGARAGVAHGEALAGEAAEERPARRRAVEDACCRRSRSPRRANAASRGGRTREHAAREALADVVVRVADRASARSPGASHAPNDWPGRAAEREPDRPRRQPRGAVRASSPRARAARRPCGCTLRDRELAVDRRAAVDAPCAQPRSAASRARRRAASPARACAVSGAVRRRADGRIAREVDAALPATARSRRRPRAGRRGRRDRRTGDPEPRHDPARLLGDEEEEVDDVLGLALEAAAQLGILRRDPDRARVQVAGAHHHAAGRDQRRGREAHLVGAEQRGDRRRRGRSSAGRRSAPRSASAGR